jgi:hypothetical protein
VALLVKELVDKEVVHKVVQEGQEEEEDTVLCFQEEEVEVNSVLFRLSFLYFCLAVRWKTDQEPV